MSKKQKKEKGREKSRRTPRELVTEINRYGYSFSLKAFWFLCLASIVVVAAVCSVLQLKPLWILAVVAVDLFFFPKIIHSVYHALFEQKRFIDSNDYMDQMMSSFKKRPNILYSLQETLQAFPKGMMHDKLVEAINIIMYNQNANIYQDAFEVIEKAYGNRRMRTIHTFMREVEEHGGTFSHTLDILLDDRRLWMERSYEIQAHKKLKKTNIFVSVIASFVMCVWISYMLPENMRTMQLTGGQIINAVVIIANIIIAAVSQILLSGTWFDEGKQYSEKVVMRTYDRAINPDWKKLRRDMLLKELVLLIVNVISYIYIKNKQFNLILTIYMVYLIGEPSRCVKNAKKAIVKEVNMQFPNWVMELVLLLQSNNVYVAIERSLEKAPVVLKPAIKEFIQNANNRPDDVNNYLDFLSEFDLPDVRSTMRQFYAQDMIGTENSEDQINEIIKRNNVLLDKAERRRGNDVIALMGGIAYLPVVTMSIKILADTAMSMFQMTKLLL